MNQYISFGGGVNSTAMTILILTDSRPTFKEIRERGPLRRMAMTAAGARGDRR